MVAVRLRACPRVAVDRTGGTRAGFPSCPHGSALALFADATPLSSGVSLDTTTGVVTVTPAPALGVILTADVEFDVPVRFDVDEQQLVAATRVHHDWTAIPIVELRP